MSQADLTIVEQLASRLDPKEQLALLEHVAANLRRGLTPPPPRDLYGIWRGRFADDFDIDSALRHIRTDWQREAR
jgi:hypothetical protein